MTAEDGARHDVDAAAAELLALQHTDHPLPGWDVTCRVCRLTPAEAFRLGYRAGRDSVGLGDFLPNPCGDEYSSYPWYIAETYGDYVTCSRSRGHDGQHEHSDSGMTWSTR